MYIPEKLAVLVICFNPTKKDIKNTKKNISFFKSGIIIWNSKKIFSVNRKNFLEIEMEQNIGQAKALNIGFENALKMKIDLILTLDQDSKLTNNAKNILQIINFFYKKYQNPAGFTFASLTNKKNTQINFNNLKPVKYLTPITSGSIYLTKVWDEINGFKNELFIEGVDTEFSIRAKKNNYFFYRFDYPIIIHDAGIKIKKKILIFNFYLRKHKDIRLYLQYRNNLPIFLENIKFLPKWSIISLFNLFTKKIIISILGSSNIFKTLIAILKGTIHGLIEISPFKKKLESNFDLIKKKYEN